MKTKSLSVALVAGAAMIAQANPGAYRGGAGGFRGGAVAHRAPAAHAPVRAGGFSSFRSMPTRSFAGGMTYPRQRYSSFGMRSYRRTAFRQPSIYPNGVTITRSGPYTAATIGRPSRTNRFPRYANYRSPATTSVWNQPNTGNQFRNGNNLRNGNNHLRGDWQRHVFAQQSGDWHRDWNRHSDHWWNGHRCCFINGSWVIFDIGFYPWWPYGGYYPDDYAYGYPYSGYNSPYYDYNNPYSYDSQPDYYDSGDYQGQMYYDQTTYPDQSQDYYDSSVYQTEAYYDPNGYGDQSYSNYSTLVAAQERLAREGYYRGESDGAFGPEMRQALRRYQSSHGLRMTGYLDTDTLGSMGLRQGASH
jgi:Putative peptidoglycan binding domain